MKLGLQIYGLEHPDDPGAQIVQSESIWQDAI